MTKQGTTDNPLDRGCSVCLSPAGEPCTQPVDNGRRAVAWYHLDRVYGIYPSEDSPTSERAR